MENQNKVTSIKLCGLSDIGVVREENQDAFLIHEPEDLQVRRRRGVFFAIADGMGGLEGGKIASQLAIRALEETYFERAGDILAVLEEAVQEANLAIYNYSVQQAHGLSMGSTLTAMAILPDKAYIAQVGDSRAYRYRRGEIRQVTADHSLLRELQERGEIDVDSASYNYHRNVLTRALGLKETVEVDFYELNDVADGELFLLSSDGFHELLTEAEMVQAIREFSSDLDGLCRHFVEVARSRGGPDNITVVVALLGSLDLDLAPPPSGEEPAKEDEPTEPERRSGWFLPLALFISFLAGAGSILVLENQTASKPVDAKRVDEARLAMDALLKKLASPSPVIDAEAIRKEIDAIRAMLDTE